MTLLCCHIYVVWEGWYLFWEVAGKCTHSVILVRCVGFFLTFKYVHRLMYYRLYQLTQRELGGTNCNSQETLCIWDYCSFFQVFSNYQQTDGVCVPLQPLLLCRQVKGTLQSFWPPVGIWSICPSLFCFYYVYAHEHVADGVHVLFFSGVPLLCWWRS